MKQKLKTMALAWALTPCLAFATTWYVDGTNGSDDNAGTSQDQAKATIQAAIDASVDNDTILVAPGTYAPIVTGNKAVSIVGMSGAPKTIIDAKGLGRCVDAHLDSVEQLEGLTNTFVKGFTLINANINNLCGGACCGRYDSCVIRNCWSTGGGGAGYAILRNCLLSGNYAINGGATECCDLYNCTVVGNSARDSGSAGWLSLFFNCAVYGNSGYSQFFYWNESELAKKRGMPNNSCRINIFTSDPHFVDAAHGDYRLAADSPCIDAGDNSYVVGERDLDGSGRIVNGRVDIGCYEYGSVGGPYVEKIGETNWTYMIKNGKASVGDGVGAAVTNTIAGAVDVPSVLRGRPVTAIDHSAFLDCGEMTSVTIPASVTEIGSEAFSGCEKLADVWFEGNTIGKIGRHAFLGCYWDLIVHVPAGWQGRGRTIAGYTVWRDGSSDVEKCVNMSVTNVVVQYVLNSIQPEIAVPVSNSVGFVNIITEVASSGAVSVPTEWKDNYQQFETKFGTDFGKALAMKTGKKDGAGNDMFVWQDFVAGTDPTDEEDVFTASITIVDGVPVISYTPELTAEQAALRVYKTYGKTKLTDTAWTDITSKTSEERANYNFFKVTVEMK